MYHTSQIKIVAILMFFVLFFTTAPVFAANIFLGAKNQSFAPGEEFLVRVLLNTEGESINAIEGKIGFPADLLEVKEIRDGNSIINFWVERPSLSKFYIPYSGIIPGGYMDKEGLIFSVVFRAKKEGIGAIQTEGLLVLLNDGKGTEAKMETPNLEFRILKSESQIPDFKFQIPPDTDMPESFEPKIASDPNVFDGKYFLVFATQDKISGIANYKIREGRWGWFSIAESPYLLKHQSLDKKIFVKAIDKSDNERIVVLPPQKLLPWYENYWIIGIIILSIIIAYRLVKILW